ncbi:MAG: CCA tRNA nucleotidyltransferase [Planctomycetes bacterium]|nr:CCA tRNA nucleotidyltransferase [Planctomycetota bacterium]
MTSIDPRRAREFAQQVVVKLRASKHEALWAGGCVRDELLGKQPKDYDVATDATPAQVREVFGNRRTLPIGAAFGVITVLGPREAGQVEVATFRRDATYSDGRHPDSVAFSDAREDAKRRDFTINGLFYDPLSGEVIDYVGGQEDLKRQVLRAIGNPDERLAEDKLRMLRAVRFATTLGFDIESETMLAIQRYSKELRVVSVERITAELRRLLQHSNRRHGLELLRESCLLQEVLPELPLQDEVWTQTLETLDLLDQPSVAVAIAVLVRSVQSADESNRSAEAICRRWKLSNEEREGVLLCLNKETTIRTARTVAWPELQRVLIVSRIDELMSYCRAIAQIVDGTDDAIQFCRQTLARPQAEWNPPPLISGDDLMELSIPAGSSYRKLLTAARDAQLLGEITDRGAALTYVLKLWEDGIDG